jgi:AAA domain
VSLADKIKPAPLAAAVPRRRTESVVGSRFDRARKYVAKMDPAISGQNGHGATWAVARKCAADFELSVAETLDILREFNTRCQPAWSDVELQHKAEEAGNKARVANPVEDREQHWTMPSSHYTEPSSEHEYTDADAPDAPPLSDLTKKPAFTVTDVAPMQQPTATEPLRGLTHLGPVALVGRSRILELAAQPIDYVWEHIAVAGTVVLIAGPPAEGKTTLLFLILAARMNPGEVVTLLGHPIQPAPPGKWVVLIEGEHSEASTGRALVKSLKLLDLDDSALDRIVIVARKAVRLGSLEWNDVLRMVQAGLVSDIAIDTVARVAPADPDSEREQVAVFDAVAQAIEAAPAAPKPMAWLVAHTRKNANAGGLADVSGSAQRTGQADSVLMLKGERVDGQTISSTVTFQKLREPPDDYPTPVTFAIERNAEGELRINNSDGKTVADDRPLETRIVEKLHTGPKTKTALSGLLKRSDKDVDAALSNLFAAHAITTTYVKVRGKDCKAFELRPEGKFE